MGGVLRAVMEQAGRRGSEQGRIVTAVLPYSPLTLTHLLFIVIAWLRIEATLERQHWNLKEKRDGGRSHV